MKRLCYLLVIFSLVLLLTCVSFAIEEDVPPLELPSMQVAALLALSGGLADQAIWTQRGIEFALEDVREAKRVNLNVVYEDTQHDPRRAVDAYRSLLARSSFPAMITAGSGVGLALSPLANRDKVVQLGALMSTPKYSSKDDFNLRTYPSATGEGEFLATAISSKLKKRQVAIFSIQNDYAEGVLNSLREGIDSDKLEIVFNETFLPGTTDFRTLLLKLKKFPDALPFLIAYPSEGPLFIKQARSLGIAAQILVSPAVIDGEQFFKALGASSEGILSVFPFEDASLTKNQISQNLQKRYEAKHGRLAAFEFVVVSAAYDATFVLAKALEACPKANSECMRSYLHGIRDFAGASRTFSFDENGDSSADYRFVIVRNGEFESL